MKSDFSSEIIYQIFPERFAIGNGKTIQQKIFEKLYHTNIVAKEWSELPCNSEFCQYEMFGGDLGGISEKLDYLEELGVTAIYITPIFSSESNHKYDVSDYFSVDEAFGGDRAFDALLSEIHRRGMKLILDLVLNHISDKHPFFQMALSKPESQYRDYFVFSEYPDEYSCWWGIKSMPELNLANRDVINYFIIGKNSVIRYWVRKGVDGIRLDCANDLGVELCTLILKTARQENPLLTLIGEVFNYAPEFSEGLDSMQTYFFTSAILSLVKNEITSIQFGKIIERAVRDFPHKKLIQNLLILSSHDAPRILTKLDGDVKKLRLALMLQFTLPGVPKIYYGDEIGMEGGADPENRAPMKWDKTSHTGAFKAYVKSLIELRKKRVELQYGHTIDLSGWLENGVVSFLRYDSSNPENYSIVVVNPGSEYKRFKLFVPYSYLFSQIRFVDQIQGRETISEMSDMIIEIGPMESGVYVPDSLYKQNYNFYKRVAPMKA